MGERDLEIWVGDNLHDLLGFSDRATAQFVVDLAKRQTSVSSLRTKLVDVGQFPPGDNLEQFASELFNRVGTPDANRISQEDKQRQAKEEHVRKVKERRRNEAYGFVDTEEPGEMSLVTKEKKKKTDESSSAQRKRDETSNGKKKSRKLRKKEDRDQDSSEPEEERKRIRSYREKQLNVGAEKSASDSEKERERDAAERDAFAQRLKERDEERTKKFRKGPEEKPERTLEELLDDVDETAKLRDISRQVYVKKREKQKLELLEEQIEDEKYLFNEVKLTKKEQEDLKRKEEILKLAKERARLITADSDEEGGRYRMPDSYVDEKGVSNEKKRLAVLSKRYTEDEAVKNDVIKTDQQHWEEALIKKATGGRSTSDGRAVGGKQYDFVIDDAVEFIKDELPMIDEEREADAEDMMTEAQSLAEERKLLPVFRQRQELIQAIRDHQVLVVAGETGSGKTTQIPQYLVEEGFGKICCTQPRRVAAMSVAARVATEMGVRLGDEVGYSIRFEDNTSEKTVIKYMTDGMMLREVLSDPILEDYHVIIIDEAHERSLPTDIAMGLVKDIARYRGDAVRVIISSATLNEQKFSDYFDQAPVFSIPGRRYPVDIYYTSAPEADYLDACCVTALQIHASQPQGDILVFLTGQEEIETAEEVLKQRLRGLGTQLGQLIIAPIYSTLPSEKQAEIFDPAPPGARKVVLATNIAETSVTIPGIVYVIDPGFCKQKNYNPKTGMESLEVVPVSRAGCRQRAGRAGRTQPGKCFRMFTKWTFFNEMEDYTVPEILRTNLAQVVLLLKSLGIDDLHNFDFIDAPPSDVLIRSLEQLYALGALNDVGQLTKLGRRMAELPLDPMMAKALIASEKYSCSEEIASICAMLSVNNSIFYRPKDKAVIADAARAAFARGGGGDHLALLNCYNQWESSGFSIQWCYENFVQARSIKQARDIRDQLTGLMDRVEVTKTSNLDNIAIRKAIASGFFYNAAKLEKNGAYRTLKNPHAVQIHPSSCLFKSERLPRYLVYHELVYTTKEFMRQIIEIESAWLLEIAPYYYKAKELQDHTKVKMPKAAGLTAKA